MSLYKNIKSCPKCGGDPVRVERWGGIVKRLDDGIQCKKCDFTTPLTRDNGNWIVGANACLWWNCQNRPDGDTQLDFIGVSV
jgi:hypothetical protein